MVLAYYVLSPILYPQHHQKQTRVQGFGEPPFLAGPQLSHPER